MKFKKKSEKEGKIFMMFLEVFLIISIIPVVCEQISAAEGDAEIPTFCCEKTNLGDICAEVVQDDCSEGFISNIKDCSNHDSCKIGCCYDPEEGLCDPKTPKGHCEEAGGEFLEDCDDEKCWKGCCVLGENVEYMTKRRCEKTAMERGYVISEDYFRDNKNEWECLELRENQPKGACVFLKENELNECEFLTESECSRREGEFNEDKLCSHPDLETMCERQDHIKCSEIEGEHGIYWYDSCNNKENIYSSDKEASWNNGRVLDKSEACNEGNENIESETCGNCNYALGSRCAQTDSGEGVGEGDYICESLNCIDPYTGKEWKNGESWCSYDGNIGDGKDTPGSKHWKYVCEEGVIKNAGCRDQRQEVCVQSEAYNSELEKTMTQAQCIPNTGLNCLEYNSTECGKHTLCILKQIDVPKSKLEFPICVPKYPQGFDLKDNEDSKDMCDIFSQNCTAIKQETLTGGSDWVNEGCRKSEEFPIQLNDLCISIGDCGTYVNYFGEGSDNIIVKKSKKRDVVKWQDYVDFANVLDGVFAEPLTEEEILEIHGLPYSTEAEREESLQKLAQQVAGISGGVGTLASAGAWSTAQLAVMFTSGNIPTGASVNLALASNFFQTFSSITIWFAIGSSLGAYAAEELGIASDQGATLFQAGAGMTLASIVAFKVLGPAGVITGIAMMIWGGIMGDVDKWNVQFYCQPWKPPVGGENCHECNGDSLKPCTEYRCNSLGRECELINKDTQFPECIKEESNNPGPPVINPSKISKGYTFENERDMSVELVKETNSQDKCIPIHEEIEFVLETNEYAECRYSYEPEKNFREMNNYFEEGNADKKEHKLIIKELPSIESWKYYYDADEEELRKRYDDMNLYVKCEDRAGEYTPNPGYAIGFCVYSGPDIEVPEIKKINPENNSFIAKNLEEKQIQLFLNEPSICKWDKERTHFKEMRNTMRCETSLEDQTIEGWLCETTLPVSGESGKEKFNIKCRDKPWLSVDEDLVNIHQTPYIYVLKNSEKELVIESFKPEKIIGSEEPINSAEIKVETSGGAFDGKAVCMYDYQIKGDLIPFSETDSTIHKQPGFNLWKGEHNIKIKCVDDAGNIAEEIFTIEVDIDTEPPKVVRAYKSMGSLEIVTDEKAECFYDTSNCDFKLENAIEMTTALSKIHTAEWASGRNYNIKCKDSRGRENSGCAIIIEAEELS